MPHLSIVERNRLVGHLEAGTSTSNVAILFRISERTVYGILKKSKDTESLKDRPRSDHPRVNDNKTDHHVVIALRGSPFKTVQSVAIEFGISRCTVARGLAFAGVKAYRPAMKQHKLNCLH